MSQTLERVRALVRKGEVRVSVHGYDELAADDVQVRDVVEGLATIPAGHDTRAVVVTAYRPDPAKWDETWQRSRR